MGDQESVPDAAIRFSAALSSSDGSARVQAALSAGTYPQREYVEVLVKQCAHEPDFYVREMLTWALVQQDREITLDRVIPELESDIPQARSQALHTLSKIGDDRAWPALSRDLLHDADPEVARAAWRTAAGLAPDAEKATLAEELARHFATGDLERRRSLTRAFVTLGAAALTAISAAENSLDAEVRAHALATAHLVAHPEDGFEYAMEEARRTVFSR